MAHHSSTCLVPFINTLSFTFTCICRNRPTKLDIGKFACLTSLKELRLKGLSGLSAPSFSFSGGLPELVLLKNLEKLVSYCELLSHTMYSKTCLKPLTKRRSKLVFKTEYRLMHVKSIAECSKGSILKYF